MMTTSDAAAFETSAPPIPDGWTRCHEYMKHKGRFCRQECVKDSNYCGNHSCLNKRIPCPIDPSHSILASQVEQHVRKCPFLKRKRKQEEAPYYRENINCGGHGTTSLNGTHATTTTVTPPSDSIEWAQHLALEIIQVHQRVFTEKELSNENVRHVSLDDIFHAIPFMDLSQPELDAGLQESVDHYMIKSGGARHLTQQASLVGYLRRIGVFNDTANDLTLLEMGAGRGMFGLIAAGVAAAAKSNNTATTRLVLVEKSGSRSKADGVLRMAKEDAKYMALPRVHFSRITCDLSHVHMPTVLVDLAEEQASPSTTSSGLKRKLDPPSTLTKKTVVIAKHLCGAGTDLALKSLRDVRVDACVMAPCCHGVCSWHDYVGRDFLQREFGGTFGPAEFDLLRRWSSGTVSFAVRSCNGAAKDAATENGNDENEAMEKEHGKCSTDDNDAKDPMNVSAIIKRLGLGSPGAEGLGRACQRLLDQGRLEYMQRVLFQNEAKVEMFHYVSSSVTPQNAVLVALRK